MICLFNLGEETSERKRTIAITGKKAGKKTKLEKALESLMSNLIQASEMEMRR